MGLVVGISGPPGSGKSLLTALVTKRLGGVSIYYDDYQTVTKQPVNNVAESLGPTFDINKITIPGLAEDLLKLKSGNSIINPVTSEHISPAEYIFFETPLGKEHLKTGSLIDLLVWIDVPLDVALARNIKKFTNAQETPVNQEEVVDFVGWLNQYVNSYLQNVREMLLIQHQLVKQSADIVLDGLIQPGDNLEILVSELMAFNSR